MVAHIDREDHLAEDLDNNLTDAECTRLFKLNRHSFGHSFDDLLGFRIAFFISSSFTSGQ